MRNGTLIGSITVGVIGLCLMSTVAQAQQAAAPTAVAPAATQNDMNEIIVTARRVAERLQTVPISITVYDQKQLTDHGVYTIADLAAFTPSLSANSEFGSDNTAFGIRGFQQVLNTAVTVATYFGDVVSLHSAPTLFAGNGGSVGSFFDLQNVQVLKGPQGTLFGVNTTGGAVLLVPKKPTSEFEGYVEVSGGNYGMERVQAVVNVPLDEKLRLRIGLDQQTRDGYLNNISGIGPANFGDVDYVAGRVSLVANITDDIENYTIFSIANSNTNGITEQPIFCNPSFRLGGAVPTGALTCAEIARVRAGGPYAVDNNVPNPESNQYTWQVINTTTWQESDDLTIKNIASYGELKDELNSSLFGIDWQFGGGRVPFSNVFTPVEGGADADLFTFTEEFQLQGHAFDNKLDWQGGVYMADSHSLADNGNLSASFLSCTDAAAFQCSDPFGAFLSGLAHRTITFGSLNNLAGALTYRNYGVYAQTTYHLTDEFKLTGGLRYTYDSSDSSQDRVTNHFPQPNVPVKGCVVPTDSLANNCLEALHESSHAPTWLIDFDYTPNDNILAYVKYARGYREGGIIPASAPGYSSYQPEQVDSYELGTKTTFHAPVPATVDASVFYNDFTNQQIPGSFTSSRGAGSVSSVLNAGSSRLWGVELEATVKPIESVTLDAGYTYLNTKILSLTAPVVPSTALYNIASVLAYQGDPMPLTPTSKWTISGTYRLPLDPDLGPVTIGANFVWTGRELINSHLPFARIPGYGLLNLNVNWESVAGKPIDVEFFMNNALDRNYATYFTDFTAVAGLATQTLGPPRMFGGRVRVHF